MCASDSTTPADRWPSSRPPAELPLRPSPRLLLDSGPNTLAPGRERGGDLQLDARGRPLASSRSAPGREDGGGAADLGLGTPAPKLLLLEPSRQPRLAKSEP